MVHIYSYISKLINSFPSNSFMYTNFFETILIAHRKISTFELKCWETEPAGTPFKHPEKTWI